MKEGGKGNGKCHPSPQGGQLAGRKKPPGSVAAKQGQQDSAETPPASDTLASGLTQVTTGPSLASTVSPPSAATLNALLGKDRLQTLTPSCLQGREEADVQLLSCPFLHRKSRRTSINCPILAQASHSADFVKVTRWQLVGSYRTLEVLM